MLYSENPPPHDPCEKCHEMIAYHRVIPSVAYDSPKPVQIFFGFQKRITIDRKQTCLVNEQFPPNATAIN